MSYYAFLKQILSYANVSNSSKKGTKCALRVNLKSVENGGNCITVFVTVLLSCDLSTSG